MVGPGDDFDDLHDDEPHPPLLPPDDRLWRHPSELFAAVGEPPADQVLAARRRWLTNTPTRAGAGTAGLVGAVLAAGVVLVGVHLTSWLTPRHAPQRGVLAGATTGTTMPAVSSPGLSGLLQSINSAVVKVRSVIGSTAQMTNGVVMSENGYVLVASAAVEGAMSVSVMLADGEEQPARVVGADPATGLAVLRLPDSALPWLTFSDAHGMPVDSFFITVKKLRQFDPDLVTLSRNPVTTSLGDGPALLQLCPRSLHLGRAPDGTVIVNSSGELVGFVTSHRHGRAIATPGWLAARIAADLIATGHVSHGWLGIVGQTTEVPAQVVSAIEKTSPGLTAGAKGFSRRGVKVLRVESNSAAAQAGINRGDIIEAVDGQPVHSMASLRAVLYLMTPSTSVQVDVVRGNQLSKKGVHLQAAA